MRITQQLLRSKANGPLQSVEFLDLSNVGIDVLEKLNSCPKLQSLNLRGNNLVEVANLEQNKNLWRLDLSNNQIVSIDGLSKFIALGVLNLANNDLSWHEVGKLRHLHVLDVSLHGNRQLEKDPYYRIHLIDCLPHAWMLDGRIITSAERLQAKYFFADSALTEHPIRKKLSKEWFVPSAFKKIEVNGVYGEKATHMMIRFPSNGSSNSDMDRRKLRYLAHNVQEDMILEKKATKRDFQVLKYRKTFLEDLLDVRAADRERCNMLLVLLVATLEFVMPTHLVKETLEVTKLSKLGKVYTMDLFLLPKDVRCRIVCILLGAVKIDKDIKEDGGLYDRLYLCLFYTIAELTKLCNSIIGKNTTTKSKMSQAVRTLQRKFVSFMIELDRVSSQFKGDHSSKHVQPAASLANYGNYKCLLASEVVQLLCIVPAFFEYVDRDVGVMNLIVTATGDATITDKIVQLSQAVHSAGGDLKKLYEELSDFLLQRVQEHSTNLSNAQHQSPPGGEQMFTSVKGYRSIKSPLDMAEYLAKGLPSPNVDPPTVLSARTLAAKSKKHFPHLGDYLLLGPQTLGKIISLPQPFIALVSMDSIPVANGAMESKLRQSDDHYTYVNMDQLAWDTGLNFWKPKGSIGDRFTIHTIEDLRKELIRRSNVVGDHVPRPNSPAEQSRVPVFPLSPGRESTAPLIYSSTFLSHSGESFTPKSNNRKPSPRPMSSLLKEKLDLKLDLNPRRSQSASATDSISRSSRSPTSPTSSPDRMLKSSASDKEIFTHTAANDLAEERVRRTSSSTKSFPAVEEVAVDGSTSDCVHCAIAAVLATDPPDAAPPLKAADQEHSDAHGHEPPGKPGPNLEPHGSAADRAKSPMVNGDPVEAGGSTEMASAARPDTVNVDTSHANGHRESSGHPDTVNIDTSRTDGDRESLHSDEEPELQNLTVGQASERSVSAPPPANGPATPLSPAMETPRTRKSTSTLQINIPQVDLHDPADRLPEKTPRGRAPVMKGRQTPLSDRPIPRHSPMSARAAMRTSRLSIQGRNRPFSAMDAYRFIVNHPRKPICTENGYNTTYQQQRTEAWRQSAQSTAMQQQSRQSTPPPQRPTSPDGKGRPTSAVSVQRGSDWLGGGRDLYWEEMQQRPVSCHIPGWKEGLPDNMKRPKSAAVARTMKRQTKRTVPLTPSSMAYESMLHGSRGQSPRNPPLKRESPLPDMLQLSDYQPLYHHLGVPRRLGDTGSPDIYAQSAQDTVYRTSSPVTRLSPNLPPNHQNPVCMQCIYEDEFLELLNATGSTCTASQSIHY